jgi:hypothetical protein
METDSACCAASCVKYYAVPVSAYTGWNDVCVRSVVSKAIEIATAKVYEVMHMTIQQGQWRKCLAATAMDSTLLRCCRRMGYAVPVSPLTG